MVKNFFIVLFILFFLNICLMAEEFEAPVEQETDDSSSADSVSTETQALESASVEVSDTTQPQVNAEADSTSASINIEMWNRFKIKMINDTTILLYAFKTDIRQIFDGINSHSKNNKFVFDSTIYGISPEISVQKENFDFVIDKILNENNMYRKMILNDTNRNITLYRIIKGSPPKEKPEVQLNLTLEQKLKSRTETEVFQNAVKEFKVKGKSSIPALVEYLNGNDKTLREAAVYILGEIRDRESIPILMKALKTDPSISVKMAVIKALIKMEKYKEDFLPDLLELYDTSTNESMKVAAMTGYVKISPDVKHNELLLKEAVNSPFMMLRLKAVDFTLLNGNKSVLKIAMNETGNENTFIRKLALEALADAKDMRGVPAIKDLMADPDADVRVMARVALRKIEYANILSYADSEIPKVDYLRQVMVGDVEQKVKLWAAQELLYLGQKGMEVLQEISRKSDYGEASLIAEKLIEGK
ncbi:HEAT repeat domain-containing protein [Candidatus Desantisbacteria bacterium]|nr:HEAT repeat domain-containing protein [Candidatus Desantisbacteria bacterium]